MINFHANFLHHFDLTLSFQAHWVDINFFFLTMQVRTKIAFLAFAQHSYPCPKVLFTLGFAKVHFSGNPNSTSKAKFSESVRMNIDFQIRTAERICPYSFIKSRDYLTYLRMHTDELVYYSSCGMYVALIHTCNVLRCAAINQVYRPNNSALHTRFIAYRTLS